MNTMPAKSHETRVLQLKVVLLATEPPVWRRFVVRDSVTFDELHDTIQVVMGWTNSHLYEFTVGKKRFTLDPEEYPESFLNDEPPRFDSRDITLRDALGSTRKTFQYIYDFGDGWQHEVTVEGARLATNVVGIVPRCLEGQNACPPPRTSVQDRGSRPSSRPWPNPDLTNMPRWWIGMEASTTP